MIKVVFLITQCKKCGPIQQMLNIIKYLDRKKIEPFLVTIYPENKDVSQLDLYKRYVKHYYAPTSKLDVILGRTSILKNTLSIIKPDVIHSLGVFPDFAISRMRCFNQVITSRNFIYDDYPAKYGRLLGFIMAKMHIYALTHSKKTVTCSESLAKIYKDKLGLSFDYVRNGVDLDDYKSSSDIEKIQMRRELNISQNTFLFIYTGQLIERKNMPFLLDAFVSTFKEQNVQLLVCGGGSMLGDLKNKYASHNNVIFMGNVMNVSNYLKAADAYISASKSEGLPNGVLEAMATKLPVVLSDIPQHLEIYTINPKIGQIFKLSDIGDCSEKMEQMMKSDYVKAGKYAYGLACEYFGASVMSQKYQEIYAKISNFVD